MAMSSTLICNMALARIGSKRRNHYEADESVEAIHCRTHYEQVRDALLRSHSWRFATGRAELSGRTDYDLGWDNQFDLPTDFMRMKRISEDNVTRKNTPYSSYQIEGQKLLTNDGSVRIVYIKKIIDETKFDSLFVEVFVLSLAVKLAMPISQNNVMRRELQEELMFLLRKTRTIDKQETNTIYRDEIPTWNDGRRTSAGSIL